MQTVKEIKELLSRVDAHPQKRFGQCFLIDLNQMRKVLDIANLPDDGSATVLEVGPGTGSLTEELLERAAKVVAVEIDKKLAGLLRRRLITDPACQIEPAASPKRIEKISDASSKNIWRVDRAGKFVLIEGDILAGKSRIAPAVLSELGPQARLVANLPYNIATPLIAECLLESWRAVMGFGGVRFDTMTFTVQQEVAERFVAKTGREYGQVSVLIDLLSRATLGPVISAGSFWPQPKIASQIVHIEFDPQAAMKLKNAETLQDLLGMTFTQRRKRISSTVKSRGAAFDPEKFSAALIKINIDASARADNIPPQAFLELANELAEK